MKQTEACQWRLSKIPKRTTIDSRQLKPRQALSKHNGPEQSLQQSLSFQTHFLLCSIRLVAICPPPMDFPIRLPNPPFSSFLFLISSLFPVYLFSVLSLSLFLSLCFSFPFFSWRYCGTRQGAVWHTLQPRPTVVGSDWLLRVIKRDNFNRVPRFSCVPYRSEAWFADGWFN